MFTVTNKINEDQDPNKPDIMSYINTVEEITTSTYNKVCGFTTNSLYSKFTKESKYKLTPNPEKHCCDKLKEKSPSSRYNYIAYLKENLKKSREAEKKNLIKNNFARRDFLNLILEENDELRERNIRRLIVKDKNVNPEEKKRMSINPDLPTLHSKVMNKSSSMFSPIFTMTKQNLGYTTKHSTKKKIKNNSMGSFDSVFHPTSGGMKRLNSQLSGIDGSNLEIAADIGEERSCSRKLVGKPILYKPSTKEKIIKLMKTTKTEGTTCQTPNELFKSYATKFASNSTFISLKNCNDEKSKDYKLGLPSSSDDDDDDCRIKEKIRSSKSNNKMMSTSMMNTLTSNKRKIGLQSPTAIPSISDSIRSKIPNVPLNIKSTKSVTANLGFPKGKVGVPLLNASNEIISKCNSTYQKSLVIKEEIVESDKKSTQDDKILNFKENLKLSIGKHFIVSYEAKMLQDNHMAKDKTSSTFVFNSKKQSTKKRFVSTDETNMLTKSEAINTINSINAYKFKNYLEGKFKVGLDKEDVFGLKNERLAVNIKDKIIIDPQKLYIPSNNLFSKVDEVLEEGIKRMNKIQSRYLNNQ